MNEYVNLTSRLRCAKVTAVKAPMNTGVRNAQISDWMAVEALCNTARYRLPQMWQWENHLASDAFFVTERDGTMVGAIFAWPDESSGSYASGLMQNTGT